MPESQQFVATAPEVVWATLRDLDGWTEWDDAIEAVSGDLEPGGIIEVTTGSDTTSFAVRRLEPPEVLLLESSLFFGALVITRMFRIEPSDDGAMLTVVEQVGGWLAWALGGPLTDVEALADGLSRAASEPLSSLFEGVDASELAEVAPTLGEAGRIVAASAWAAVRR